MPDSGKKKKSDATGRKVRVPFRPNRSRPSRSKDWTRQHEAGDEIETSQTEHVVARGDLSRKRTIIVGEDGTPLADEALPAGTVVALRGQFADVDDGQRIWPCTVRRVLRTRSIRERFPVTVGDRVGFEVVSDSPGVQAEGVIVHVQPRKSELKRVSGRREHVLAANVDQVLVVSSANEPPPKPHLIDRYIAAALAGGMVPVVCMNKIDLDVDGAALPVVAVYERIGYQTLCTDALRGRGIDALRAVFLGKSTVLAGQSGVGKSSLLNALQPGLKLRVGEVSAETSKGRHTTSTASLIRLDFGAYVVDTPGIRSFDVSTIPAGEIEQYFEEFVSCIPDCHFADCTHIHEADCAVQKAVAEGRIEPSRYESYVRLLQERVG
jgi:ribosome biogenesis GTPase